MTKSDLAAYFTDMAEPLLAHLQGRPCSLLRAPDGVSGETFLQRHPPPGVRAFTPVWDEASGGEYFTIDSVEGLVAAAQLDAVELHPWNCAPFRPGEPGRLVIDLDPAPGVTFAHVVAAAHEVRERLADVRLVAFCKTTGGKGLHVTAPILAGELGWDEAIGFARKFCRLMAADAPARYLIAASKSGRAGRIFLDYLRNARAATAVAPWSPRARPGATVATPLAWSEAAASLDPATLTIWTAPRRAAADPWSGYTEAARPLAAAIAAMGGL